MAVELGRFIEGQLNSSLLNHSERAFLEDVLRTTQGYNAGVDSSVVVFGNVNQAIEAYKSQPRTPELVTETHQAIWQERGRSVGETYEVTFCPYTQEELAGLEQQGRRVGYLPPGLETQQNRHLLGKMFPKPKMGSYGVLRDNRVTNDENPSGWFDYEGAVNAPYLNTTEEQLRERVREKGRKLLTLNQYIIASQDSKLLTGQYLDEEGTWVRLGSRNEGRVVQAYFDRDGRLDVLWELKPGGHDRFLGGRSSGAERT